MKIKRVLRALLILAFLISTFTTSIVAEEVFTIPSTTDSSINVLLNGTELSFDVPPQIINGRTMVPMRVIFEELGAGVEWVEDTQTILVVCGTCKSMGITHNIRMKIGDPYMYTYRAKVNPGELPPPGMARIELDVPPMIIGGRTLVPVRAVAEALNTAVEWDGDTQTVMIRQETKVDINDSEVQELFNKILNGDSFISYYEGYADVDLFDSEEENFSWMGGRIRELITILSLKNVPDKKYTDAEARDIITQFLSKGEIVDEMTQFDLGNLQSDIDRGKTFGETAKEERLVGVYKKSKIDEVSIKLFGAPLPKAESVAYSIAYASFFLCNRTNLLESFPISLPYILYYNEASEEYLFTADLYMLSQWEMEDYLDYYNEHYEPLKSSTKLLRATRHNDEISLYVYREAEFGEYSGGTGVYKGEYRNTYKKGENGYYWVSSYGIDE